MLCWRCNKPFIPNPSTGNCIYCAYPLDEGQAIKVQLAQAIHELSGNNVSVYATDVPTFNRDYPAYRRPKAILKTKAK
jgi:hypothetical protein